MYFIILLIVILVFFYLYEYLYREKFISGYDPSFFNPEPVDYNTRKQDCGELTYTPTDCVVDTVVPSNKIVCNKSLSPITNNDIANQKTCKDNAEKTDKDKTDKDKAEKIKVDKVKVDKVKANKDVENKKNPTLSLKYDFDLLSSFNNSQIEKKENDVYVKNNFGDELETFNDLKTDVRSLNSLENDLISNY